jgi:hypothetical protein
MLIGGLIALVAGALLLWGSARAQKRALALRTAPIQTAAALETLRTEMAAEVGAGALRDLVAVEGTVECARPLTAEVSGQPCVYYDAHVEREYEETREEGGRTSVSRGSETVASNTQRVDFELRDATGAVVVVPADANIDARKTVERFEPAETGLFGSIGLVITPPTGMRRTLGYKVVEHALAVGDRLYVLGEARDRDGRVAIVKPQRETYIISGRTKDELIRSSTGQATWMKVVALAALAGGVALEIAGLFRR